MVLPGNFTERLDLAGASPNMYAQNTGCAGCEQAFYLCGIDIMSERVHITEDRRDLLPLQCVCAGNKCKRRHDDFTLQAEGTRSNLQGNCGIAHGNAMLHSQERRQLLLPLPDK